jgi:hypothetical protein
MIDDAAQREVRYKYSDHLVALVNQLKRHTVFLKGII